MDIVIGSVIGEQNWLPNSQTELWSLDSWLLGY